MDCEKFDQHVIDALFGELDELTQAGLDRHVEGCSRCGPAYAGLKATRAVAVLPLEEPPADLEARILAAADLQIRAPWRRRVARAIAWAGAQAARPQIAVAAVFLLMVGSSLFLFQAGSPSSNRAAAPAAIAADTAAPRDPHAPAATAEAQAIPTAAPSDPDLSRKVASERSADAGKVGGDTPAAEASAAATAVAAVPASAAPRTAMARSKSVEPQAAADEGSSAAPRPPAAKPPARSVGGTNPRAPAAPRFNDAYH